VVRANILIVDDEQLLRWSLKERLEESGHRVVEAETGREAIEQFASGVDLVLLDYRLPDADGLGLLERMKAEDADVPVILMTAYSSVDQAVQAIKGGAYHYLNKPFDLEELVLLADKALETTRLRREVKRFRARESEPYAFERILGTSEAVRSLRELLRKIAATPASTVLLTGGSGTGKDLAARCVHHNSDRALGPFMHITCSAMPESLLESELFGHEKGAFTDARQQKKGLLELADGGTVFLDEIGEMAPVLQAKLLRFLEEKAFKRVGGPADVRVDVRVIAATHRDLRQSVAQGTFRADLYYRLSVLNVPLPSLRERASDIRILIDHYIDSFNREFHRDIRGISRPALAALERYGWPGNIRELRNAIERAVLLAEAELLGPEDFQMLAMSGPVGEEFALPLGGVDFEELERSLVVQALERTGWNQTRAAALLGMNRDQIRYRIGKFRLEAPEGAVTSSLES
jgi:DNA-binding NtrC family response regulator